jgi:hypothetical protein
VLLKKIALDPGSGTAAPRARMDDDAFSVAFTGEHGRGSGARGGGGSGRLASLRSDFAAHRAGEQPTAATTHGRRPAGLVAWFWPAGLRTMRGQQAAGWGEAERAWFRWKQHRCSGLVLGVTVRPYLVRPIPTCSSFSKEK